MILSWVLDADRSQPSGKWFSLIRKDMSRKDEMISLREAYTDWVAWCEIYGRDRTAYRCVPHEDGPVNVRLTLKPFGYIRQELVITSQQYVQIPTMGDDCWLDFRKHYRLHRRAYNWPR